MIIDIDILPTGLEVPVNCEIDLTIEENTQEKDEDE